MPARLTRRRSGSTMISGRFFFVVSRLQDHVSGFRIHFGRGRLGREMGLLFLALRETEEGHRVRSFRAQMSMREPAEYGNDEVPIPVFYVLEIYQDTFWHENPVVEIHTAEPLSPISVGDYLYEVSFPDPLAVPRGHILQVAAKQHVISTHARDQVAHITKVCVKAVPTPDGLF
jgi:hypothetical protein